MSWNDTADVLTIVCRLYFHAKFEVRNGHNAKLTANYRSPAVICSPDIFHNHNNVLLLTPR